MAKVLLTGAAGFIGSHVSELLLKRGDEVVGIDNLNDYYSISFKKENLDLLSQHSAFRFVEGDICDRTKVEELFRKESFTHVAHIAARAGVRPSIQNPFLYEEANIQGTLVLLECAVTAKVTNFVLTSSSSVYGNSTQVPFREDDSATDRPISQYAATKKACELLAYTYHQLYELPVNVVRPFTVYGPRGRPDMAPWLFVQWAFEGKPIRKFGDGSSRRDYTFIGDFAEGFVSALDRPLGYEIFNLGNSATVSLNEFLSVIAELTGQTLEIEQLPMQPGDVNITYADLSKARQMLSYHPKTSIREGMSQFVAWYKSKRM